MGRAPLTPAVLTRGQAAAYIGMSASWLKTAPMPRVDMGRPGGRRARVALPESRFGRVASCPSGSGGIRHAARLRRRRTAD